MKWLDSSIALLSWVALAAKSADTILTGFSLQSVCLQVFLLLSIVSFYYLKDRAEKEGAIQAQPSLLVGADGLPAFNKRKRDKDKSVIVARVLLILGIFGVVITLLNRQQQPSLHVTLDRVEQYSLVSSAEETIYSSAGEYEGILVYGVGQQIIISLKNGNSQPLSVRAVSCVLAENSRTVPSNLNYRKVVTKLPHTRLPIESVAPIIWRARDNIGASKTLGEGLIRLEPSGSKDDTHGIKATIKAEDPGFYVYSLKVVYEEPRTGRTATIILPEKLAIVLRGT